MDTKNLTPRNSLEPNATNQMPLFFEMGGNMRCFGQFQTVQRREMVFEIPYSECVDSRFWSRVSLKRANKVWNYKSPELHWDLLKFRSLEITRCTIIVIFIIIVTNHTIIVSHERGLREINPRTVTQPPFKHSLRVPNLASGAKIGNWESRGLVTTTTHARFLILNCQFLILNPKHLILDFLWFIP